MIRHRSLALGSLKFQLRWVLLSLTINLLPIKAAVNLQPARNELHAIFRLLHQVRLTPEDVTNPPDSDSKLYAPEPLHSLKLYLARLTRYFSQQKLFRNLQSTVGFIRSIPVDSA